MRAAIVHERLTEVAGSEHVVTQLSAQWPDATIHIPIVDRRIECDFSDRVQTGALSQAYRMMGYRTYAPLLPLTPVFFSRCEFGPAELVFISHHAFGVAAVYAAGSRPTIAYVHSPARWAWDEDMREGEASSLPGRAALSVLARLAMTTEVRASQRLTTVVANSTAVAERIRRHWNREATVVHPPVDTEYFTPDPDQPTGDYYLVAGRLVPYKRPDIAIKAAIKARVPLVVAGAGRGAEMSKELAEGHPVSFTGRVSNEELRRLMRGAKALIMPGEEDFGIVPVEAMACGTPVIALGVGGARDSIVDGVTGRLMPFGDDESIIDTLADELIRFARGQFDTHEVRRQAERFSRSAFRRGMADVAARTMAEHSGR